MDLDIKGKAAIVAASSRGLGKAVAKGLAREGVNLVIFSRTKKDIENTANEISNEYKVKVFPVDADVSKESDLDNVIKIAKEKFSTINILINNAGGPPLGLFENFEMTDWKSAIDLNLLSTIYLSKKVVPEMKKNNWGRIINITSIAVKQPIDGLILSNTVRAGVTGFSKTLSNELGEFNITVNNVCPGRILTDRIKHIAFQKAENLNISFETAIESMKMDIPLKRIGNPEEFADLVVFLASERASYITGNTIQIDGGLNKGLF
ncbi:MAG: SDR family oxidoreductase [Thermodesulfobacteriota bacterium]